MADEPKHLTGQAAVRQLFARYQRFREDVFPERQALFESLAEEQRPSVLFITCSDSRVVPDLILQSEPGDLFVCRNAGNIVPPYGTMAGGVSATVEYAVAVLGVRAIVVCGHSDCGAMRALLRPQSVAELPTVRAWLEQAETARRVVKEHYPDADEDTLLRAVIEENVVAQIEHLETHPYVAARLRRGELDLYGWVYRIHTGEIVTLDASEGRFVPLDASLPTATLLPRRRFE